MTLAPSRQRCRVVTRSGRLHWPAMSVLEAFLGMLVALAGRPGRVGRSGPPGLGWADGTDGRYKYVMWDNDATAATGFSTLAI